MTTDTAKKPPLDKDIVLLMAKEYETDPYIIGLVEEALSYFDIEGPVREMRGFNSLVQSAALGVAITDARLAQGVTNPQPIRSPVIVWYSTTREEYDVLIAYKAVQALGIKWRNGSADD